MLDQIPYRLQKKELKVGEITHTGHVKRRDLKREAFKSSIKAKIEESYGRN